MCVYVVFGEGKNVVYKELSTKMFTVALFYNCQEIEILNVQEKLFGSRERNYIVLN